MPVADDVRLERNLLWYDFRVVLCGRRVSGPPMCGNPDAVAPDPTEYCRGQPGAIIDPSSWQRDDRDNEVDVMDNWQGNQGDDSDTGNT